MSIAGFFNKKKPILDKESLDSLVKVLSKIEAGEIGEELETKAGLPISTVRKLSSKMMEDIKNNPDKYGGKSDKEPREDKEAYKKTRRVLAKKIGLKTWSVG